MADFLAGYGIWATWTAYGLILFIFLVMAPCHAVFLLPFIGIPLFWLLPLAYALPINLLIWLVSLFVFRMIRRAMIRPPMDGFSLTGTTARVVSRSGADHSARYLIRAGTFQ